MTRRGERRPMYKRCVRGKSQKEESEKDIVRYQAIEIGEKSV